MYDFKARFEKLLAIFVSLELSFLEAKGPECSLTTLQPPAVRESNLQEGAKGSSSGAQVQLLELCMDAKSSLQVFTPS